jgi:hypothetical protein
VKQGCPLSPLLFIISYDPLLSSLASLKYDYDVSYYAFADDLAITTYSIPAIYPALNLISCFSHISGLGINKDKSCMLSTAHPSRYDLLRPELVRSPWPDLSLNESGTHLGIKIGYSVTLDDIWAGPVSKATSRINSVHNFINTLSFPSRVLYINVFIISLFSYIGLFFVIPPDIWRPLKNLISRIIIPFNGGAFTYESAVCSNYLFSLRPALKDVWAFVISLLAVRSPYIHSSSNYNDLPHVDLRFTKLISCHRNAAAIDFWRSRHLPNGVLVPLSKIDSSSIYKVLIRDVYLEDASKHCSEKVSRFIANTSPSPPHPDVFQDISLNLNSISLPPFLIMHHFNLLNNSLATSRRMRHQNKISIDKVEHCFFCGRGQDSLVHIYCECFVINRARFSFFNACTIDFSPFVSLPSCTSIPSSSLSLLPSSTPPSPFRKHLFPSLLNFLSSFAPLHPSSPPPRASCAPLAVGYAPLGPTFLAGVTPAHVKPILAFNYAVWCYRKPALAAHVVKGFDWVVNRVVELATNLLKQISKPNKKRERAGSLFLRADSFLNKHNVLSALIDADTVCCYGWLFSQQPWP